MVAARAVEQGREFLDPAVLEKTDGFGTRPCNVLLLEWRAPGCLENQYWRCSNG